MECEKHDWHSAGLLNLNTEDGLVIMCVLYCSVCGEIENKLVPGPERSPIARARSQILVG